MKISLSGYFAVYVLVFLAGVLGAWLIALWNRQRQASREQTSFPCPVCTRPVPVNGAILHARCPSCGVRNRVPHLS